MKYISAALMLLITGSAYAELTTEYLSTNEVRISRIDGYSKTNFDLLHITPVL